MELVQKEFSESVVQINRVSKKTKGGNQMRFAALVVVGNRKGKVGVGLSKGKDVRSAIQKAIAYAKRHLIEVPLRGTTIPYQVKQKFGAAYVLVKPATSGTGIMAGGPMRVVLDSAGVSDVVGKILGSKNKISNVYATMEALKTIKKMSSRREK